MTGSPNVILISGQQGSGKTTLAKALSKRLGVDFKKLTYELSFAGVIYEIHDAALAILSKYGIKRDIVKDGPLLQLLGTEWGRKTIDENIWVDAFKGKIGSILKNIPNSKDIFFISPDCRFKNEFNSFPDALRIRLECDREIRKQRCEMWRDRDDHISETDLDEYVIQGKFNLVFRTDKMSVDECVEEIIKTLNLGVTDDTTRIPRSN